MKSLQKLLRNAETPSAAYQFLKSDVDISPEILTELLSLMVDTLKDASFELLPETRNKSSLLIRHRGTKETASASIRDRGARYALLILNDLDVCLGTDSVLIAELWGEAVTLPAAPMFDAIVQIAAHSDSLAFLPADERSLRRTQEAERLHLSTSSYIRLASSALVRSLRLK
ncbi:hypothetical protein HFO91_09830 [Rhizobium leguminosarum]|uniref:hypothetical protein n=1 Tax=Rhizobium leguminosarum TaxID=384 RepID=UPI001C93949F|nr:hypothetical protein [Rhizobium leguminosarum]MBY5367394.1 hypothetical protein [Rhizobium leguminosarum]MBY5449960.1 hypothetical protein [Rhizobium leguminosarum]